MILYWLALPKRIVKWFFHEKPWRWRPGLAVLREPYDWRFGVQLYFDWSDDQWEDFNSFGLQLWFARWGLYPHIHDND